MNYKNKFKKKGQFYGKMTTIPGLLPSYKFGDPESSDKKSYWLGTRPLCNAKEEDCENNYGFYASNIDSKGCENGKRVMCSFNPHLFKKSDLGKEILENEDNPQHLDNSQQDYFFQPSTLKNYTIPPYTKWFGDAPLCKTKENFCKAVSEGYYPIKRDKYGDGSECYIQEKVMGVTPFKQQQLDFLEKYAGDCMMYDVPTYSDKQKLMKNIFKDLPLDEKIYWANYNKEIPKSMNTIGKVIGAQFYDYEENDWTLDNENKFDKSNKSIGEQIAYLLDKARKDKNLPKIIDDVLNYATSISSNKNQFIIDPKKPIDSQVYDLLNKLKYQYDLPDFIKDKLNYIFNIKKNS